MCVYDVVAHFDLCKELPESAFADSVFVWHFPVHGPEIVTRTNAQICDYDCVPAPTLEEVLKGADAFMVRPISGKTVADSKETTGLAVMYGHTTSEAGTPGYNLEVCEYRDLKEPTFESSHENAASAALKAWLRVNTSNEKDHLRGS